MASEKEKEYQRQYYLKNKERITKQHKKWYEDNKEQVLKKEKIKRESDIEGYRKKKKEQRRKKPKQYLLYYLKRRAKAAGRKCSLKEEDIVIPEFCPITGEKLIAPFEEGPYKRRYSIDRIDSSKDYTPDNVWVISCKANSVKNDLTLEEMKTILENLVKILDDPNKKS